MKNLPDWAYVVVAVLIALSANSLSAVWAKGDDKFSIWLLALLLISPLVFITFGLTTSKLGVAVSSGVVDSLLTASTIVVGLLIFQEWNRITTLQYLGIGMAFLGVCLMLFSPKVGN